MTNVYDRAHELARALQSSEEALAVENAMKEIDQEPETKKMLNDFRTRQVELQQKMMTGAMPDQDEMQKMEQLYQVISMNTSIAKLFDAERRLASVIQDVNKIVTDSLSHLYQE
ncbi:YlbF family regulator [Paenibacillus sp. 1001270B_150601_E10]|uniref:YlbF family regulator n=1 Tax=Paenibacillus sp. 1001270B_150601_E10 TaxID=2787079 RepID=UPI00189CBB74|nr:YlbF family regulator [Paenibacillus sp. 1001270B_150601_E10]